MLSCLSRVWLFAILWIVAHHTPLSMGFSRQKYWSGCHFLLQGIFPTQGSNLGLLCLLHWPAGTLPLMLSSSAKEIPPQENGINITHFQMFPPKKLSGRVNYSLFFFFFFFSASTALFFSLTILYDYVFMCLCVCFWF